MAEFLQRLNVFFFIAWDVAVFFIRLGALYELPRWHTPATATAWLLVIFFWPTPGIIAYSVLGTQLLPSRRLDRHREMLKHFQTIKENFHHDAVFAPAAHPALPESLQATARLASNLGSLNALDGNSVRLITDADEFIGEIVAGIDAATQEVDLLYYILNDDVKGHLILEACARAASRGVTVRILADSVGSRSFCRSKERKTLSALGIHIAEALPVRIYRTLAARFDLRNHRKLALFDHVCAVTGSHNVTASNYGRKDNLIWKDISLLLRGPVVQQLESVFVEDWYVETGEIIEHRETPPRLETPGNACLQTVPSGPSYSTQNYQRLIIASIIGASHQVTITTPYLIPDQAMLQAVEVACLKGVKVRLVLPQRSDQIIVGYASRAYYEEFLKCGVEVYLYTDGLLHSKTVTIDDELSFVGSSNFDIRSFEINFEINMILYGKDESRSIRAAQEDYISSSRRLTPQEWNKRNEFSKGLESLTKLFSPLL